MSPPLSPLTRLYNAVFSGETPPFDWVVEYANDGTIGAAWHAESRAESPSVYAMLSFLLKRQGKRDDRLFRAVEAMMLAYAEIGWSRERLIALRADAPTLAEARDRVLLVTRRVLERARADGFPTARDRASRSAAFWSGHGSLHDAGMIYQHGGGATDLYRTGVFTYAMRLMRKRDGNSVALFYNEINGSLGQWYNPASFTAAVANAVSALTFDEVLALRH